MLRSPLGVDSQYVDAFVLTRGLGHIRKRQFRFVHRWPPTEFEDVVHLEVVHHSRKDFLDTFWAIAVVTAIFEIRSIF